MVSFTTTILKFDEQGEKTGWTYIEVPAVFARQLYPDNRKSFRVQGKLDNISISAIGLIPMGEGNFILPLNAQIRKSIGKRKGSKLEVNIERDYEPIKMSGDLIDCLADESKAFEFFKQLTKGHQKYFSDWIDSAKTQATKTKRIALSVNAMARGLHFGQMLREQKTSK